jgi:type IV pilus assembly protein PilW
MRIRALAAQSGFSLIELLVAMAIGLALLAILATVFANSSRSQQEITMSSQQVENGRYAIEILSDELNHAGYYGYYSNLSTPAVGLPDPCSTATADIRTALTLPIQGYDSPATSPISCLADANFVPNTDILVVRRAATAATASGSLVASKVYIQSNTSTTDTANPIVALGNGTFSLTVRNGSGSYVAAPIRELKTHIYFVAPCSTPSGSGGTCTSTDDGGSPIPTLKRMELTTSSGSTSFVTYPLVEGVQNLQIEYGVDSDADGSPNATYVTLPSSTTNWQNVMAARIYVLARNTRQSPGYTDNKTYTLGSTTVTGSGSYRRHVYDTTVRVKNPSERRESP